MSAGESKSNVMKGRRWVFSKKKMKHSPTDDSPPQVFDLKRLLDLRHIPLKLKPRTTKCSQLNPSLQDILKKSVALGYFLEYLKEVEQKHLLDFYLEAETFRLISRDTSSSSSTVNTSYSTRSSPCMQRYRTPSKHRRTFSSSSNTSSVGKSRRSHSIVKDETPIGAEDGVKKQGEGGSMKNVNKHLFPPDIQTDVDQLVDGVDSVCVCDSNTPPEEKNDSPSEELLIDITGTDDKKTDEITVIRPSNHEWTQEEQEESVSSAMESVSSAFTSEEECHAMDSLNDSPVKGFEHLFIQKNRSNSTMSLEELSQRSRKRSTHMDAMAIYTKYLCGTGNSPIDMPTEERLRLEGAIGNKDKECSLDPNIFVLAQDHVFLQLKSLYEKFQDTDSMISYQIKLLEEKQVSFTDILYSENILFYFMEFLDQSESRSVLEFYITAQNFEDDIEGKLLNGEYDADNAVNDAMHIYERYFSMKCDRQLIEDDKLRIVLENNICREGGPQPNCFCIPLAYAWTVLNDVYMPVFMKSDIYTNYISHLKNTIACHHPDDVIQLAHAHINTTTSSQCTHSMTSLESGNEYEFKGSKLNLLDDNLEDFWFKGVNDASRPLSTYQPSFPTIVVDQQYRETSGLTMGHVSEFGIFNSEMAPEPPKDKSGESSVSKFGKAMKNFLRRETPEETEQLAWRRAEKIISDIQKETHPASSLDTS